MVHVRGPGGIKSLVSSYGRCLSVLAINYSTIEQQDAAIVSTCTGCFYFSLYTAERDVASAIFVGCSIQDQFLPVEV